MSNKSQFIPLISAAMLLVILTTLGAEGAVLFTNLHSFTNNGTGGYSPIAGLIRGGDGNLYGTTSYGGAMNSHWGTVFKIGTNGAFTSLYSFTGGNDGAVPAAALALGNDGNLYGTTSGGGVSIVQGFGSIFKITTSGAFTLLHSFASGNGGAFPYANLAMGNDGNFYGTTSNGGVTNWGTVFKIGTNGAFTSLYSFTGGNDGGAPYAGLTLGADGNFYGTASQGGAMGYGTVFKIATNGGFTPLHSFTGGSDGSNPHAGLVQGSDGNLYGTTISGGGGVNGCGIVFRITPNGTVTLLHAFTGGNDGCAPYAGLTLGTDGNFYGTANTGGSVGVGVIFKVTAGGTFTLLYTFTGQSDGQQPQGVLVQGSGGGFFGVTQYSYGSSGWGGVFRVTVPPPSAPVWQTPTLLGGTLGLKWSVLAGGRYQLQYKDDLNSTTWTNLGAAIVSTSNSIVATDTATNLQRFYRVGLLW